MKLIANVYGKIVEMIFESSKIIAIKLWKQKKFSGGKITIFYMCSMYAFDMHVCILHV